MKYHAFQIHARAYTIKRHNPLCNEQTEKAKEQCEINETKKRSSRRATIEW